jgi:hypothetical protein
MDSTLFECPINLQPKLVAVLPGALLAVMIVGGWTLFFLTRRGLLSQGAGGMLGTLLFFLLVAGVLAVSLGGKGRLVVQQDQIVLHRGLAGKLALPLADAEYALTRWRSMGGHWSLWHEAGPQLRIDSAGRTATIAAMAPAQGEGLPPSTARFMDLPTVVIDAADFLNLLDVLGLQPASSRR